MKFSDMPYSRPNLEEIKTKVVNLLDRFNNAKDVDSAIEIYREYDEYTGDVYTNISLAYIRNSLDTTDEFYDKEKNALNEISPLLREELQNFAKAVVDSKFRKELEQKWGTLMFENIEMALKTFKPEIIAELQEENKLTTEYGKLVASAQIEFDGKKLTLAQMGPYRESKDRTIREKAALASSEWWMQHIDKFDSIFDQLVQIRIKKAEKLGYKSFIELGYDQMTRNCYDKDMVKKFRDGVVKYIVPIVSKLKKEQAERINVETIKVYDDPFEWPDGNAQPVGTPDDIFAHGKKMYHELSNETKEFIDFMLENELFDVLTRPGKSAGGYCAHLPKYKSPFIFANFNGTSADIDVLTHEAGHAYAGFVGRDIFPSDLQEYTYETAEIHSMSMEFLTWPWMEGFFGEKTQQYYYSHLASALIFLPYGCMVDEFQHLIYENPNLKPEERNKIWLELESKYRPYLDVKDFPFHGEGRRWQAQGHIYQRPFYYIDYCLAQIMALNFWAQSQENHKEAFDKYKELVSFGGKKTFLDVVQSSGLPSPFIEDNINIVAKAATKWLDSQNK